MTPVELSHVTKSFGGVCAVDDLSLTVPPGVVYGFIGPNGSGKTTTMRMIVNIFYPDRGMIRIFDAQMRGARSELVGYLPEERGLYQKMTVQTLLEFYGELRGGRKVTAEVNRWLEKFEISRYASHKVEALSKGTSQKVQFIAAVVPEPKLLILDEPFTGLDPVSVDILRDAILEMSRRGVSVILSTHDMTIAETMCDYILMIFRGRKVIDGTLASIQDQYGNDTVRVAAEGGTACLEGLPGVEKVRDFGQIQELRMYRGHDPHSLLPLLAARTHVTSFSVTKPSLHDIFVRIASPDAAEGKNA